MGKAKTIDQQIVLTSSHSVWTEDDEADLRALLARRKKSGFRKPSHDVGQQRLILGSIRPNPKTVAGSIVALVGLRGTVTRRELLADMAEATFLHPKAQPKNPKWCQDYIAGALRYAYLEIVPDDEEPQRPATDTETQTPVRVRVSALNEAEA